MLTVYRKRSDIPAGATVIDDAQWAFANMKVDLSNELVQKALLEIDGATVNSDGSLTSKYGNRMFLYSISMGCQCAIVSLCSTDIVNMAEAGDNAFSFVLRYKLDGAVFQSYARYDVVTEISQPVMYGGVLCTTMDDVYEEARK